VKTTAILALFGALASLAVAADANHARDMAEGLRLFQAEIRPLFTEHCLECHGGKSVKGDFDLATRETFFAGGLVGTPGGKSPLLAVLRHEDEPFMPHKKDKLPDAAIDAIARWIALGAPYDRPLVEGVAVKKRAMEITDADREFWSFRPLAVAAPPAVRDTAWPRTDLDRFILAALEKKNLAPNAEADRRTFIRRAHLDLLGLPPSSAEIDAFVADPAPDAAARLVDRLLASPHYGERWARHWLDIARFAESHGFEQDYDRPYAYHYRDFLIRAFNADLPYDDFVRWQLAGDELAPGNPLALAATGFLGAGAFPTEITEAEFEKSRYDELDDMVGTTGNAMLGLTISCARCHDHKYDPIPAADYYRFAATFTRTIRSYIDHEPEAERRAFAAAQDKWFARAAELAATAQRHEEESIEPAFRRWLAGPPAATPAEPWRVLDFTTVKSAGGATLDRLHDGSVLLSGENPDFDFVTFVSEVRSPEKIAALRLEALAHPWLPRGGPGRAHDGNFTVSLRVKADPIGAPPAATGNRAVFDELVDAVATFELNNDARGAGAAIDDNTKQTGWSLPSAAVGRDQALVVRFAKPQGFPAGTRLTIVVNAGWNVQHIAGRMRLSVSSAADAPVAVGHSLPQRTAEALAIWRERGVDALDAASQAELRRWFARTDARWSALRAEVDAHAAARPRPPRTKMQITADGFPPTRHNSDNKKYPHFYPETHLLARGDPTQKSGAVAPGFLQVLARTEDEARWRIAPPEGWTRSGFQRAGLAHWMTDTERGAGHLLARVIVNRVWHHHFGRGLVDTPSDFGVQGGTPSHPELLDWLARDLIAHGWRLKRLHRLIMTSAVYRVGAEAAPAKLAADPDNVLHWRWTPRRLEAEAMRDSLLSVSGLLDPALFGPGSLDPDMNRRSVYFFIKRSELVPAMMTFDWPEHLVSIGQRSLTTVSPQALKFLNSPQSRRYAQALAERVAAPDLATSVQAAYRLVLGRPANEHEVDEARTFVAAQREAHAAAGQAGAERLALADYCQAVFSLNEFLYIR
jgi:mono/diheme cytochrome c family protein